MEKEEQTMADMVTLKETGQEADRYERCVCCRRRVDIPLDMDIEFRPFYIEGAGQLCYDCYHTLYAEGG